VEKIKPERSRKRKIIIFVAATVINVALLALLAWQLLTPAQPPRGSNGNTGVGLTAPLKEKAAPNFMLPLLSEQHAAPVSLARYKGEAIVLNFWASWCTPCQEEASIIQAEWQKVHSRNIVFLGVDFQDTQAAGLSFLHKYRISYPNVADATGMTAVPFTLSYTPTTFFINSKGIVINSIEGQLTAQQLSQNVQALLG
jgi:cytochrome c biogenesis protein CcmG/thiol:disulfide interchange protein DsbE